MEDLLEDAKEDFHSGEKTIDDVFDEIGKGVENTINEHANCSFDEDGHPILPQWVSEEKMEKETVWRSWDALAGGQERSDAVERQHFGHSIPSTPAISVHDVPVQVSRGPGSIPGINSPIMTHGMLPIRPHSHRDAHSQHFSEPTVRRRQPPDSPCSAELENLPPGIHLSASTTDVQTIPGAAYQSFGGGQFAVVPTFPKPLLSGYQPVVPPGVQPGYSPVVGARHAFLPNQPKEYRSPRFGESHLSSTKDSEDYPGRSRGRSSQRKRGRRGRGKGPKNNDGEE